MTESQRIRSFGNTCARTAYGVSGKVAVIVIPRTSMKSSIAAAAIAP